MPLPAERFVTGDTGSKAASNQGFHLWKSKEKQGKVRKSKEKQGKVRKSKEKQGKVRKSKEEVQDAVDRGIEKVYL